MLQSFLIASFVKVSFRMSSMLLEFASNWRQAFEVIHSVTIGSHGCVTLRLLIQGYYLWLMTPKHPIQRNELIYRSSDLLPTSDTSLFTLSIPHHYNCLGVDDSYLTDLKFSTFDLKFCTRGCLSKISFENFKNFLREH